MGMTIVDYEQWQEIDLLYQEWEKQYAEEYRKQGLNNHIDQRLASYFKRTS